MEQQFILRAITMTGAMPVFQTLTRHGYHHGGFAIGHPSATAMHKQQTLPKQGLLWQTVYLKRADVD